MYTVYDILDGPGAVGAAEKVALIDGPRRVTYAELREASRTYAGRLKEAGVQRGDRVGIFLRRSVEAVAALFATHRVGGVAVVIHDSLRTRQLQHILDHSQAVCLVTDTRQLAGAPGLEFPEARTLNLDRALPPAPPAERERTIGTDLALIIYTSGSTGLPKGVMLSHANLLSGAQIVSDYLRLRAEDVIISLLPFSFDYGLNQLLTALAVGGTLVIQRSLFPFDVCSALQREGVTGMAGVPALWLQLAGARSPFSKMAFPRLRYITNSGGHLPEPLVRAMRTWHPQVDVYLMYGLTEAFRSTYLPPGEVDQRPGCMGKAIPNTEILVVDDAGRPCRAGEVGELVHRGATVARGYWRDAENTARVFRPHPFQDPAAGPPETVVFSGDMVKKDEEGYLYYVGRKDHMIKSNGFRVSPEEIESGVFASQLVAGVVSFAVPLRDAQVEIVAAVIPKEPSSFDEDVLHRFCRADLPEYLRPHVIWRREEFPLTTSGKPDRQQIRNEYVQSSR